MASPRTTRSARSSAGTRWSRTRRRAGHQRRVRVRPRSPHASPRRRLADRRPRRHATGARGRARSPRGARAAGPLRPPRRRPPTKGRGSAYGPRVRSRGPYPEPIPVQSLRLLATTSRTSRPARGSKRSSAGSTRGRPAARDAGAVPGGPPPRRVLRRRARGGGPAGSRSCGWTSWSPGWKRGRSGGLSRSRPSHRPRPEPPRALSAADRRRLQAGSPGQTSPERSARRAISARRSAGRMSWSPNARPRCSSSPRHRGLGEGGLRRDLGVARRGHALAVARSGPARHRQE